VSKKCLNSFRQAYNYLKKTDKDKLKCRLSENNTIFNKKWLTFIFKGNKKAIYLQTKNLVINNKRKYKDD